MLKLANTVLILIYSSPSNVKTNTVYSSVTIVLVQYSIRVSPHFFVIIFKNLPIVKTTGERWPDFSNTLGLFMFRLFKFQPNYRIVASTNTCYYSENQIFWFLKSWIVTCRKFIFMNKSFVLVVQMSWKKHTWQTHHVFVK